MVTAKNELTRLWVDCLSEEEAQGVLDLLAAVPALIDDCILIKHELTRIYVENTSLEELPRGIFLMSRLKEVLTPCADIYLKEK